MVLASLGARKNVNPALLQSETPILCSFLPLSLPRPWNSLLPNRRTFSHKTPKTALSYKQFLSSLNSEPYHLSFSNSSIPYCSYNFLGKF